MTTTPKTGLTDLSNNAGQHLVVNGDWSIIDQLLDRTVKDKDLATPPGSPADGDAYIVAGSPTGVWNGKATQLAFWRTSAGVWQFIVPRTGWTVRVSDELDSNGLPKEYGFDGANWELVAGVGSTPVQDEGSTVVASPTAINFVGAGVSVTDVGGVATVTISGGGAGGVAPALQYTCETGSTADSDPGAGLMKWNHATQASATQLFIDDLTADAVSMTTLWGQLSPNGFLLIQKASDANTWQLWKFTSITAATGYVKLGVTLIADGGAFTDGDALLLEFDNGASGGGGLTNLTESKNSSTPNATVPVVSLTVTITETNGDVAVAPKGTGAVLAAVPTNTASGGNKRGNRAVDWQLQRFDAAQVASGNLSTIAGGEYNTASALAATVGGGSQNTASTNYSTIGGGQQNTASGIHAAVAGGYYNEASGSGSAIPGGFEATARSIRAAFVMSAGMFSAFGDAQRGHYILRRSTTNNTPARLSADASNTTSQFQVTLPNNSAYIFRGKLIARQNTTGDCSAWEVSGVIKRGAAATNTALVGTPTVAMLAQDAGAAAWSVAITADTTTGCLAITVTGETSKTIRWVADIETVEVAG